MYIHIEDLPAEVIASVHSIDLACLADHVLLDFGMVQHLFQFLVEKGRHIPRFTPPSSSVLVLRAVRAEPGIWTAKMCRMLNGLPETEDSIIHCGLCAEYANPRKRARAAALPPVLPGFERIGGAYQLHPPCLRVGLTALRKAVYRLERQGLVQRRREKIPDTRNFRGWDWASRLCPMDEEE